MDVSCDKCGTEYELDEARLKPNGVTVKCTTCGNLFRVRRRIATAVGLGINTKAGGIAKPIMATPTGRHAKERTWLVRLPTGQVETCHALATLQQWIISGRVSRNSSISRTGKTWKKLGDIAELSSFFEIAEQARAARRNKALGKPGTPSKPGAPSKPSEPAKQSESAKPSPAKPAAPAAAPPASAAASTRTATETPAEQRAPGAPASTPPRPVRSASPSPQPMVAATSDPPAAADADTSVDTSADTAASEPAAADEPTQPDPATSDEAQDDKVGPTGGMTKGIPTTDVAFGKSRIRPIVEHDLDDDFDDIPSTGSKVGRWIVAVSLIVMAGAALAIYLLVFRTPSGDKESRAPASASDAGADGSSVGIDPKVTTPDGTPVRPAAASAEEVLAAAQKAVLSADSAALEEAQRALAALPSADEQATLIARSRVLAALAQQLRDEASFSKSRRQAKKLKRQADDEIKKAQALTKKALSANKRDPLANAVMADLLRLQGKRSRNVDRYLKTARKRQRKNREADLVQALTYLRDKRTRKGRGLLDKLQKGDGAMASSGDVRPAYHLALLAFRAENHEEARTQINAILALQPNNASASALLARIRAATAVDTSDPLPPEDGGDGGDSGDSASGSASYDSLLAKADRKAEHGDCDEALRLYKKATDINPLGVAALTGTGYCYMDDREFSSARAKFKAALVGSPTYQDAMMGLAESYAQQGDKDNAIAAYKAFIKAHPNSRKTNIAKRQLKRLGGSLDNPDGKPDPKTDPAGTGDSKPDPKTDPKTDPAGTGDSKPDPKTDPAGTGDAKPDSKTDPAGTGDSKPDTKTNPKTGTGDTKPDPAGTGDAKPDPAKADPAPKKDPEPAAKPKDDDSGASGAKADGPKPADS